MQVGKLDAVVAPKRRKMWCARCRGAQEHTLRKASGGRQAWVCGGCHQVTMYMEERVMDYREEVNVPSEVPEVERWNR